MSVALSRLSTTGRPMVRFGTKWPSITSTCSQSAPCTAAASSASRAKSAARIDGAISGPPVPDMSDTLLIYGKPTHHGCEHSVGAVSVRPQLHVGTVAQAFGKGLEQRSGIERFHRLAAQCVADHTHRLG